MALATTATAAAAAAPTAPTVTTHSVAGGTITSYTGGFGTGKLAYEQANLLGPYAPVVGIVSKSLTAAQLGISGGPGASPDSYPGGTGSNSRFGIANTTPNDGSNTYDTCWTTSSVTNPSTVDVSFTDSYGDHAWLGSSPVNASEIAPTFQWWLGGIDVSVSVPAGITFSSTGSGVEWNPGAVDNTWQTSMTYNPAVTESTVFLTNTYIDSAASYLISGGWYYGDC